PANFYQIQTKFRDEVRPRFGVMRAREFIMKDAYSFHASHDCLVKTYDIMHQTYCTIFKRIGLDFRPVLADTGSIGGTGSHEFHVLADSGEDDIVFSDSSAYAANIEMAEALAPAASTETMAAVQTVATPGKKTIEDVCDFLNIPAHKIIKTLIVLGCQDENGKQPLIALVLRGDHQLNEVKASKLSQLAQPLTFASDERIASELGLPVGYLGPLHLTIPVIADRAAAAAVNFVCGANRADHHVQDANWGEDASFMQIADIRNVVKGDPSPCGQGVLDIKRGIEVGHIFQLGTKYSEAMKARVLDEQGKEQVMVMGCYGIGVSRVVAATIEQNHDEKGIIWPCAIAPFHLALIPINLSKSSAVAGVCEQLYQAFTAAGIEVLFMDEAKARLGGMLADAELIGIPHRIVVGDRGLEQGMVEYKGRVDAESANVSLDEIVALVKTKIDLVSV
ncbi:MAG: hypothetical protein RL497_1691, partial [Pseudomonadota bacterium]